MTILIVASIIIARPFLVISPLFFIDAVLLLLSFLVVLGMFTSMNWFYQFYVVTNKRILHIHFLKRRRNILKKCLLQQE